MISYWIKRNELKLNKHIILHSVALILIFNILALLKDLVNHNQHRKIEFILLFSYPVKTTLNFSCDILLTLSKNQSSFKQYNWHYHEHIFNPVLPQSALKKVFCYVYVSKVIHDSFILIWQNNLKASTWQII